MENRDLQELAGIITACIFCQKKTINDNVICPINIDNYIASCPRIDEEVVAPVVQNLVTN